MDYDQSQEGWDTPAQFDKWRDLGMIRATSAISRRKKEQNGEYVGNHKRLLQYWKISDGSIVSALLQNKLLQVL